MLLRFPKHWKGKAVSSHKQQGTLLTFTKTPSLGQDLRILPHRKLMMLTEAFRVFQVRERDMMTPSRWRRRSNGDGVWRPRLTVSPRPHILRRRLGDGSTLRVRASARRARLDVGWVRGRGGGGIPEQAAPVRFRGPWAPYGT